MLVPDGTRARDKNATAPELKSAILVALVGSTLDRMLKQFYAGDSFHIDVTLETALNSGETLCVELLGPSDASPDDKFTLRGAADQRSSVGAVYRVSGPIPEDAPPGLYEILNLEIHREYGLPKTQGLDMPEFGYNSGGFEVLAPEVFDAPRVLKID